MSRPRNTVHSSPIQHSSGTETALAMAIETLEHRRLLAGLVEVTTNGAGDVIVDGDNLDNNIRVELDRVGQQSFLMVEGNAGTQIEFDGVVSNSAAVPIVTTNVDDFRIDRDLRITMRGGSDQVEILAWSGVQRLEIGRDLNVNMGTGSDSFNIEGLDSSASLAFRNLTVNAVAGNDPDYIEVNHMQANRIELRLGAAGDGIDQAVLRNALAEDIRMNGTGGETELSVQTTQAIDVRLTTGIGEDQIIVSNSSITSAYINSGSAPNDAAVGDYILFGSGNAQDLTIIGGAGRTTVEFTATSMGLASVFSDDVTVNTGAGDDTVRITNDELTVFLGELDINTGSGNDTVQIEGENFFGQEVDINLSAGDDNVFFDFNPATDMIAGFPFPPSFFSELTVRGGAGNDTIHDLAFANLSQPLDDVSIELFV